MLLQKMVIDMQKLERVHYLKHYLGRPAIVLDEHDQIHGEIENVDIEDNSVQMKTGERSIWFEADRVTPSLKKFKDLTDEDLKTVFEHARFRGVYPILSELKLIRCANDLAGYYSDEFNLYLDSKWNVWKYTKENSCILPDNIGIITLLLCEMGYDVTGIF